MQNIADYHNTIKYIPGFNILTGSQKAMFENNFNVVTYRNGVIIFRQSTMTSHVMYVKSGLVKIFREGRNGKVMILDLTTPGNYLGLLSVFGGDLFQYSASSVETTEIVFTDISVIRELISNNSDFSLLLHKHTSNEGLIMLDKLSTRFHKQLPGRIADVLLFFSEINSGSSVFQIPLTRRELAEFAGTTKESFIRTLTEFKNDKIINLDGKKVEIVSMDIVKSLSRFG